MKKYIILILTLVALFSCSKKNNVNPLTPLTATDANLAGKWTQVVDSVFTKEGDSTYVFVYPINNDSYFQFNSNGTGSLGVKTTPSQNLVYTISDGIIQVVYENTDGTIDGDPRYFTIREITSNKLVLRFLLSDSNEDISLTKQ